MGVNSTVEPMSSNSRRLRADYRRAFREWAFRVSRMQGLQTSRVDCAALTEAGKQVEAAQLAYRDSRDRLVDDMNHREASVLSR